MRLVARGRRDRAVADRLTLHAVRAHAEAGPALEALGATYLISEANGGLLLREKGAECRLFLYDIPAVLTAARRHAERRAWERGPPGNRYRAEDIVPGRFDLDAARQVIGRLEDRIERLQAMRRAIDAQAEQWRLRAIRAEQRLNAGDAGTEREDRYRALRRFLARRFHPDSAEGAGMDRDAMFKTIWAEIERIDGMD